MPAFSKAELTMAAMPGMGAMKMASATVVAGDGKGAVSPMRTCLRLAHSVF